MHIPHQKYLHFFSAILFLLLIQLKPIHSFSHSFDGSHVKYSFSLDGTENISENDLCQLCDFNYSPTLELSVQTFEAPKIFELITQKIISENNLAPANYCYKNIKLRAPPVLA